MTIKIGRIKYIWLVIIKLDPIFPLKFYNSSSTCGQKNEITFVYSYLMETTF